MKPSQLARGGFLLSMRKLAVFLRKFIWLNRFELVALAVVIALALISGVSYFHFDKITKSPHRPVAVKGAKVPEGEKEAQKSKKPSATSLSESKTDNAKQSAQTSSNANKDAHRAPQQTNEDQTKYISVELIIDTGATRSIYPVRIEEKSTVYDLLKQASSKYGFSLDTSYNSAYGVFIEEIAGVRNNPQENKYWLYYVNGKFASVGASSKRLGEGDKVLWKYQSSF